MTTHEVLVAARNRLERDGWYSPANQEFFGACIANAVGLVGCMGDDTHGAWSVLLENLSGQGYVDGVGHRPMWAWNDAPGRTKQEVFALFDRAIAATAPPPAFDSLTAETPAAEAGLNQGVVV